MKLPITIYSKKIEAFDAVGFSFFIWIVIHPKLLDRPSKEKEIINHEKIHFKQQVELLFIFQWILYGLFYLFNIVFLYQNHDKAYRNNPFEKEAYAHDGDPKYLENRKFWSWVKYV